MSPLTGQDVTGHSPWHTSSTQDANAFQSSGEGESAQHVAESSIEKQSYSVSQPVHGQCMAHDSMTAHSMHSLHVDGITPLPLLVAPVVAGLLVIEGSNVLVKSVVNPVVPSVSTGVDGSVGSVGSGPVVVPLPTGSQ